MMPVASRLLGRYGMLLAVLGSCLGCGIVGLENRLFPCRNYVPQSHKFGQYSLDVKTAKTTLQIGDTLFVDLKLSQQFYDSLSGQSVSVNNGVSLWVKLNPVTRPSTIGSAFAVDTTIFRVFDQYFTTRVLRGRRTTAYNFECVRLNGYWELQLQYIVLKEGNYYLSTQFETIQTGEQALPKGVCMLGDAEKFNAWLGLRTVNNQIHRVFPNQTNDPASYFGFVVD